MSSPQPNATPDQSPALPINFAGLIVGGLALVLSLGASLALAQQHLGGWDLPGCGGDSPCAQLGESIWGKVPGTEWPISFVGAAYFAGLLLSLLMTGGRLTRELRWLARLGVVMSVLYTLVMVSKGQNCEYCATTHIGNAVFWLVVEFTGRPKRSQAVPVVAMLGVFAAFSIGFGVIENAKKAEIKARSEESIHAILAQGEPNEATTSPTDSDDDTTATAEQPEEANTPTEATKPVAEASEPTTTTEPATTTDPNTESSSTPVTAANHEIKPATETEWRRPEIFTGRRRLGPEKALLRIVTFSDFQCKSCQMIEKDIMALVEKYPTEINFSMKHFPMGSDCNHYAERNMHPNSCWAARAAEAAAILHGEDGYWIMHNWLFEKHGSFTAQELAAKLDELGWDRKAFTDELTGDETLNRIQADIEEGYHYGLLSTPMVFINGVEFKGWNLKNRLTKAVDQIVARMKQLNQPPRDAAKDRPPLANEKYVNEFRVRRVVPVEPDPHAWSRGPEDAVLDVYIWGDYQEDLTRVACEAIEKYAQQHGNLRFTYRHFPVNTECNPHMKIETKQPLACRMARAAEAAGAQGGAETYWAMHDWLLANQKTFNDDSLREFAKSIGLDTDALFAALDNPDSVEQQAADAEIIADVEAGLKLGIRAVPMININGRIVGAWQRQSDPTPLYLILDEAVKLAEKKTQ